MIGFTLVSSSAVRLTSFLKLVSLARLIPSGFTLRFALAGAGAPIDSAGADEPADWARTVSFAVQAANNETANNSVIFFIGEFITYVICVVNVLLQKFLGLPIWTDRAP